MLKQKQRGIYSEYLISNNENLNMKNHLLDGPKPEYILNPPRKRWAKAINPLENIPMNVQMDFLRMEIRKQEKNVSEFVEIEPKVMESYDPVPGRVHRKVDIERKKRKVTVF